MRTGRPPLLTDEVAAKIVGGIRSGCFRDTAARLGGVSVRSLLRWLAKGKERTGSKYGRLLVAVLEAELEALQAVVTTILAARGKKGKKKS
jgi:hypothetical protein